MALVHGTGLIHLIPTRVHGHLRQRHRQLPHGAGRLSRLHGRQVRATLRIFHRLPLDVSAPHRQGDDVTSWILIHIRCEDLNFPPHTPQPTDPYTTLRELTFPQH